MSLFCISYYRPIKRRERKQWTENNLSRSLSLSCSLFFSQSLSLSQYEKSRTRKPYIGDHISKWYLWFWSNFWKFFLEGYVHKEVERMTLNKKNVSFNLPAGSGHNSSQQEPRFCFLLRLQSLSAFPRETFLFFFLCVSFSLLIHCKEQARIHDISRSPSCLCPPTGHCCLIGLTFSH